MEEGEEIWEFIQTERNRLLYTNTFPDIIIITDIYTYAFNSSKSSENKFSQQF